MQVTRRTLEKNKQNMFYSLFTESTTVYAKDDEGNLIIDGYFTDGSPIYREVGTQAPHYDTPVKFRANISGNLNEMHAKQYGVDQSSIYAEISCPKGYLPFVYGTKVWKNTPIVWEDEEKQIPSKDSADYTVVGILDEFINYDFFLLQRNNVKIN